MNPERASSELSGRRSGRGEGGGPSVKGTSLYTNVGSAVVDIRVEHVKAKTVPR
jgi:hypothetical protein